MNTAAFLAHEVKQRASKSGRQGKGESGIANRVSGDVVLPALKRAVHPVKGPLVPLRLIDNLLACWRAKCLIRQHEKGSSVGQLVPPDIGYAAHRAGVLKQQRRRGT